MNAELTQLQAERASVARQYRLLAVISIFMLCVGALFFHRVEHWGWLDAFYFCTITLTTIGYGDLVPHTDAGKLFDIFYVLVGIGILATLASTTVKNVMVRRQLRRLKKGSS